MFKPVARKCASTTMTMTMTKTTTHDGQSMIVQALNVAKPNEPKKNAMQFST